MIFLRNKTEVAQWAAHYIMTKLQDHPGFVLALPTGRTVIGLYRELKELHRAGNLQVNHIRATFNLDEYVGLGPTHPGSFRQFMIKHFVVPLSFPEKQFHIPSGIVDDLTKECQAYEEAIRDSGGIDLAILGIGQNGHIGFNEPGTSFKSLTHVVNLTPGTRRANAYAFGDRAKVPTQAITMGLSTIMSSRELLLLATGPRKRDILRKALKGRITEECPASILQLHPQVTVVTDQPID
ncbi:glucosamine-6-phosphate deaminase [Moorella naiadis]|uniref:glucosamine-6-phosphate deaminase n=1 Tax=Moorella naiadis (nom. illeg.) TaxID=3093670 RepID=UPI003D9C9382